MSGCVINLSDSGDQIGSPESIKGLILSMQFWGGESAGLPAKTWRYST